MIDSLKCQACAKRTSIWGLVIGLFLAFFKISVGYFGRSHALVASGMCNLSDVSSSIMVFVGMKYSHKQLNKTYPFGYGKLEYVAQLSISVLMVIGVVLVLTDSVIVISNQSATVPHMLVLFTAIASALFNGLMYKFSACGAKTLNSPALRSHAEHNRIDVASSLLVSIGVLATRIGMEWVDPVIAIFECLHVLHGSVNIFKEGYKGVMDASLPEHSINDIRRAILQHEDIAGVKSIRARQSGHRIFLDLVIVLPPHISVAQSKHTIHDLRRHLRHKNKDLTNIYVEVEPVKEMQLP